MSNLTQAESKKIAARIRNIEPKFGEVIKVSGPCPIGIKKPKRSNFESLAGSILSQQLSTKAAATIIGRVSELSGGKLNPTAISQLSESKLRSAGCSGAKTRAIRELAIATESKAIPINSLHHKSDEEIFKLLLPLFGVGQWTVEMFLIFQLGRIDIWPVGDLGVRRGWEKIHRLRVEIEPNRLKALGEKFSPHRSHLAWYCWRALDL